MAGRAPSGGIPAAARPLADLWSPHPPPAAMHEGEICPWPSVALATVTSATVYVVTLALGAGLKPPRVNEVGRRAHSGRATPGVASGQWPQAQP